MKLPSSSAIIVAASFIVSSATASAEVAAKPISLQSGHSIVLSEPGLTRVAVGDGQIAGVLPIGRQQVVINGKTPGRTTVFVWNKHGRTRYEVNVTQQEIDDLAGLIRASIDLPDVSVASTGHTILVHGQVQNNEEFAKVTNTLTQFADPAKEQKFSIVNTVDVLHPLGSLTQEIQKMPGASGIRVDPDSKGNVVVSGFVEDRVTAERVLGHVRGLSAPYLSVDGKVVDRIETATTAQIDIKVSVLEVDESGLRNLGNQLQAAVQNSDGTWSLLAPSLPVFEGMNIQDQSAGKGLTFGNAFFRIFHAAPTLNALITEGHVRTLSSPDLTTMPGTEANFLVGGQIPYVYSTGVGQYSVEFKDYGVKLKVTPTILANGSIQAVIAPEISDLDQANSVVENGFTIPALTTSKLSTTAVMRPGQSAVMGGMLRHVENRTVQKWPILGNLPILGKLFTSTNYQMHKSDIVFVLTPTIINR